MQQHQPSNFATYQDIHGRPLFTTFFLKGDFGMGENLFAYETFCERERAITKLGKRGHRTVSMSHHEAYLEVRAGTPAFFRDEEGETPFIPMKLNGTGFAVYVATATAVAQQIGA